MIERNVQHVINSAKEMLKRSPFARETAERLREHLMNLGLSTDGLKTELGSGFTSHSIGQLDPD